jgi:hypothetical protein
MLFNLLENVSSNHGGFLALDSVLISESFLFLTPTALL